ncbi:hypothetical protein B9Z55_012350 [Caenorhabditis nigoni]|uniref:Translation elongation factor EF1B beta/delta subunit guanine nucleotide exchange domain-containing protein n=1 Tax=Caenorhabditis nigoni TaxID=1611254 RepID=A0A2G5TXV2_9PELO|nr:hypothetical protein B9Z55_012350 [Caenorhabditis nigoni]
MSVEGLLSEVRHFNAHALEVAYGEQLHYGGKRVFSDVKPGCPGAQKGSELKEAVGHAKCHAEKAVNKGGNSGDVSKLQQEHSALVKKVDQLASFVAELQLEISTLGKGQSSATPAPAAAAPAKEEAAGDDDFDLSGSEDDEEDEEKKKIFEERLAAYAEKKAKKAGPIAKSSVILDVKPWDDETDLEEMEKLVRSIEMDGLVWGGGKLLPIGYGIKKLQIITVIEDLKVSVDDLIEKITGDFEDHVQSVDIVAFNKI